MISVLTGQGSSTRVKDRLWPRLLYRKDCCVMIQAGILGATGYAGVELVRLLLAHPGIEVAAVGSVSFEGKPLSSVYPALRELCDLPCDSAKTVLARSDLVFAALPHGLSQETAAACDAAGKAFIDLGADFRLDDPETYKTWYGCDALYPALHQKAVYGLPELFRDEIRKTRIIGNRKHKTAVNAHIGYGIQRIRCHIQADVFHAGHRTHTCNAGSYSHLSSYFFVRRPFFIKSIFILNHVLSDLCTWGSRIG